ncbi:MAG: hypothetical protein QM523_09435 [Candidatus Pacebacteria bacterium]|nr:hypothetical protein [Candidatus Paceibacterota bacterium]
MLNENSVLNDNQPVQFYYCSAGKESVNLPPVTIVAAIRAAQLGLSTAVVERE